MNYLTRVNNFYHQQSELNNKIIQEQTEIIGNGVKNIWNAYVFSVEQENEAQRQQALAFNNIMKERFSTPEKASNTFSGFAIALEGAAMSIRTEPKVSCFLASAAWICGGLATFFSIMGEE